MANILILDNSPDLLEMMVSIFRNEKFFPSACDCINTLFKKLDTSVPDLLIADVMHTGLEEKTICNDIRTKDGCRHIPILITSTNPNHIAQFRNFCANDGIEKPFSLHDLLTKVKTLLNNKLISTSFTNNISAGSQQA